MSTTTNPEIRVVPMLKEDIPEAQALHIRSFAEDRHTLMKVHEKGLSGIGDEMTCEEFNYYAELPHKVKMMKAVDKDGKMLGMTNWGLWNIDNSHPVCSFFPSVSYYIFRARDY